MTVINGTDLLSLQPIRGMASRKIKIHGVSYGLSEAGYDIRVKQRITFTKRLYPAGERWETYVDGAYAGEELFALASTIEEFQMPNHLVGIVHDKSTWARQGLSVFNTVLEPGWSGFLTLELAMKSKRELEIPAGAGIAQVIFHEISCVADYGTGKYQNQEDKPVASRWVSDQPDMIGQHDE